MSFRTVAGSLGTPARVRVRFGRSRPDRVAPRRSKLRGVTDRFGAVDQRLEEFASDRDWAQFHTPKNRALALAGEVGELAAELQWQQADAPVGGELRERLEGEAADVLIYLMRFARVCGIDLLAAAEAKITVNETRYPAEAARGRSDKYTAYQDGSGRRV